jgi:tight adherence protein C
MTSFLNSFGGPTAVLDIFGLLTFVCSGIIFVIASLRMDREAVVRRTSLVLPALLAAGVKPTKSDLNKPLFVRPDPGPDSAEQRVIIRNLVKLGIPAGIASWFFSAIRFIAAMVSGLAAIFVVAYVPALDGSVLGRTALAVAAAAAGWSVLPVLIRMDARRRVKAAANSLPEALDLLVVCVDAGLSLEDSLRRVVDELKKARPALAEELALTLADLQILPSRDEALQKMIDRMDLPNIRAFVATLTQTLRYGTPLAQALRTIATEIRNDAMIKLEERANKLPALLTVPLILLIMPTIFLIIGGPAVLRLLDVWH